MGWTSQKNGVDKDRLLSFNHRRDVALLTAGEPVSSGTTPLMDLYERLGVIFVAELDGCFSGILIDKRQGRCHIFVDRYGMKRLFVHEHNNDLYFASEAKALVAVLPPTRELDPAGVAQFLTCGCTLGSQSLFKDIQVLPAASIWTATKRGVEKKTRYFSRAEWEGQAPLETSQFIQGFSDVFASLVGAYAKADEPVGMSLTGGLDSRMVISGLRVASGELPCYTFGSMYRDTFDVTVARQVAARCGQPHTALIPGSEFLARFPEYMEQAVIRSDGYIGFSGAAELYVNSLAQQIAPIRLTGNYGSELFRGARAFKAGRFAAGFIAEDFQPYLAEARNVFSELEDANPVSFAAFHQAPDQGYGRRAVEESHIVLRTPFMNNEIVRLAYQAPVTYRAGTNVSIALIARERPDLLTIATDRGQLGKGSALTQLGRRAWHELLFKGEYWASHGMPQWVAALNRHVPWLSIEDRLLGRHKFVHFSRWIRGELSTYVKDWSMTATNVSAYLNTRRLRVMIDNHLAGRRNFVNEIDQAMTISLATRLLLGAPKPEPALGDEASLITEDSARTR